MQSEDFDKKIKEAAEHHHPVYDEKAWDKMEKLLDKHMPTEKDGRRRIFFLLLLFLAVGLTVGGIFYLKTNQTNGNNISLTDKIKSGPIKESAEKAPYASAKTTENKSSEKIKAPAADKPSSLTDNSSSTTNKLSSTVNKEEQPKKNEREVKRNDQSIAAGKRGINNNALYKTISEKQQLVLNKDQKKSTIAPDAKTKQNLINKDPAVEDNATNEKDKNVKEIPSNNTGSVQSDMNSLTNHADSNKPVKNNSGNIIALAKPAGKDSSLQKQTTDTTKTEEKNNTTAQQKPSPKPGKQKKSAFAITFTTMPDLSMVGTSKAGKVKMGYGAGLSYTLSRFTLRSGFYVGRKVYTAGPDDYHIKYPGWPNNIILDKVDADCKVYEIPFLVSYNFAQTKKSNWFFSTGLSTYLMHRETYDYYYEYTGSPTIHSKSTTINNEYKHFFSILDISAGYERRINNMLSVSAEPYFKVPLDGIGLGKIQLNSAGVALTLSIRPFTPKK